MRAKYLLIIIATFLMMCGCRDRVPCTRGVSLELAKFRSETISDLFYDLHFMIPSNKEERIVAKEYLQFDLKKRGDILLDFMPVPIDESASANHIETLWINGKKIEPVINNEHILLPRADLKRGINVVEIDFIAGDLSLNRRDELLYTLLVPDRARTLFPCFDQPDMKATYKLTLDVPQEWECVANGRILSFDSITNERSGNKRIEFSTTEKIPTYLFSFAAGRFDVLYQQREGRGVHIYHRETDSLIVKQCDEIFDQIFYSLQWLEEYTGVDYPFTKYDIVIIPGFQYGGMEHMGATLYNANRMFLQPGATLADYMNRASLIAHETAHMWFGDYVTMKWFDDVWTKEVFANWFASQIISPLYPDIDHNLNFINSYYPSSYSIDRTAGANPIQQPLDNLNNAGLIYGNIIYNKAPLVMEMLVKWIGEESFQKGIRDYLEKFAYSNATWNDLIEILDKYSDKDLTSWSNVWIKEKGMPYLSYKYVNSDSTGLQVEYIQRDKFSRNILWEQEISSRLETNPIGTYLLTNSNGFAYGVFDIDNFDALLYSLKNGSLSEVERLTTIINLFENMKAGTLEPKKFIEAARAIIDTESNRVIINRTLGYLGSTVTSTLNREREAATIESLEEYLWDLCHQDRINTEIKNLYFKAWISIVTSKKALNRLYSIWERPQNYKHFSLGERDLMRIAYTLSIAFPEKHTIIRKTQLSRLRSKDVIDEFNYIYPSTSANKAVRDSVFNSLGISENRSIEPWCISALSYLNHRFIQAESLHYIKPALDMLQEIQESGDIFFPTNWLNALLTGHKSQEAKDIVKRFIKENADMNPLLLTKVKQHI